ncbi:E2F-associated phosphoprotein [Aulostomus maculatus]
MNMNKLNHSPDVDPYEIEEPSDEERASSSSEDELDVLLNGTPDQKKKLIREYLTGESESSSEDDFEKEMEAELSSTLRSMEETWGKSTAGTSGAGSGPGPSNPPMYDKVYFDSESDEEDTPGSSTRQRWRQRIIPTNDDLLYDPDADDRDQAWVDARRMSYRNRKRPGAPFQLQQRKPQSLPNSDAVLNCPACMTTLCLDCQRHEKYRTQYRAMFVMNCAVKKEEVLRYKDKRPNKTGNNKRRKGTVKGDVPKPTPSGMDADEVYHPVQCSECSTEVAVFDKDEVYHFFNILASHC